MWGFRFPGYWQCHQFWEGEGDVACRVVSVGVSGDCLAVVVCVESLAAGID